MWPVMRGLILLLFLLVSPAVMSAPFGHRHDAAKEAGRAAASRNLLDRDAARPRVGNEQAAAKVKRAYAKSKILSLRLMQNDKGPPIYRVKTLSPKGVVKYVYVDAINGDVFE